MEKAVSGHGVFIYNAAQTIARYGSADLVAKAMIECDMQHAWVRIHGATQTHSDSPTRPLIEALKANGIAVAGWGWCQGDNIEFETKLAITSIRQFQLDHYIADIEQGVNDADWTPTEVRTFLSGVRDEFPDAQIGVSSFAFIPLHEPELMAAANDLVDFFAPQIYWFWHPTNKILNKVGASPSEFPLNTPAAYARLCLREWRKVVTKPLVFAGQAYWGEDPDFTQAVADPKLRSFLEEFDEWDQLQGFNWWHMGGKGQGAMSFEMYNAIKNAKLNSKFPSAASPVVVDPPLVDDTPVLVDDTPVVVDVPIPPAPPVTLTIGEYIQRAITTGQSCNTSGVKGISMQILGVLKETSGDRELVSCEDLVESTGESTLPYLQPAARRALQSAVEEMGEKLKLNHAYRTVAQQLVLYNFYQARKCDIPLAVAPGTSPHELANAIDIKENARWRAVLRRHNWRWRGDADPAHFTYIGSGVNGRLRTESVRAFQRLWNRFNPDDLIEEDGIYGEKETGPRLRKSPVDGWPE